MRRKDRKANCLYCKNKTKIQQFAGLVDEKKQIRKWMNRESDSDDSEEFVHSIEKSAKPKN